MCQCGFIARVEQFEHASSCSIVLFVVIIVVRTYCIGNGEAYEEREAKLPEPKKRERLDPYEPYKGKFRRSGTGGIYELNDHLFEGRYTPTNAYGKREAHNVYAHTYEECEQKLNAMIEDVKARIKTDKERLKQQAS